MVEKRRVLVLFPDPSALGEPEAPTTVAREISDRPSALDFDTYIDVDFQDFNRTQS
jgi:hypothetical protein